MKLQANIGSKLWFDNDLNIAEVPVVLMPTRQKPLLLDIPAVESHRQAYEYIPKINFLMLRNYNAISKTEELTTSD